MVDWEIEFKYLKKLRRSTKIDDIYKNYSYDELKDIFNNYNGKVLELEDEIHELSKDLGIINKNKSMLDQEIGIIKAKMKILRGKKNGIPKKTI